MYTYRIIYKVGVGAPIEESVVSDERPAWEPEGFGFYANGGVVRWFNKGHIISLQLLESED